MLQRIKDLVRLVKEAKEAEEAKARAKEAKAYHKALMLLKQEDKFQASTAPDAQAKWTEVYASMVASRAFYAQHKWDKSGLPVSDKHVVHLTFGAKSPQGFAGYGQVKVMQDNIVLFDSGTVYAGAMRYSNMAVQAWEAIRRFPEVAQVEVEKAKGFYL